MNPAQATYETLKILEEYDENMNPAQAAYEPLKILDEYIDTLRRKCQSIRENTMDLLSFHQTPEIEKEAEFAHKMMEDIYREINKLQDEMARLARSV